MEVRTAVLTLLDGARRKGLHYPLRLPRRRHHWELKSYFFSLTKLACGLKDPEWKLVVGVMEALLALHYSIGGGRNASPQVLAWFLRRGLWVARHPTRSACLLKSAAHACRKAAIENSKIPWEHVGQLTFNRPRSPSRRWLYQLSRVSRGLPKPPHHMQDKAVEQFYGLVTEDSLWSVNPSIGSIMRFMQTYGIVPVKPEYVASTTAHSASLSLKRAEGGRSQEILNLLGTNTSVELQARTGASSSHGQSMVRNRLQGQILSAMEHSGASRSVVLPEYGLKTRIVSCSDAVRTFKSEAYRKPLYRLLAKLPCCRRALHDQLADLPFRRVSEEASVYSADLSSATDRLDHNVLAVFCDLLHVPRDVVFGGTVDNRPMVRGTLMGIPCSWVMLSLVHAWAIWSSRIPLTTCHLMGDDCIAMWTPDQISEYNRNLPRLTGMELNTSKSFISKTGGTFCERFYLRRWGTSLVNVPTLSLRSLLDKSKRRTYEEGIPHQIRIRRYLWDNVGSWRYKVLLAIQSAWAPEKLRRPRVHLPLSLGGLEVLPKRPTSQVPPDLGWLYSSIHDGAISGAELRQLSIPLTSAYPVRSPERIAADRLAALQDGLTFSTSSCNEKLEAFWQAMISESAEMAVRTIKSAVPARLNYHLYKKLVKAVPVSVEVKPHLRLSPPSWISMRKILQKLRVSRASARVERAAKSHLDVRSRFGY